MYRETQEYGREMSDGFAKARHVAEPSVRELLITCRVSEREQRECREELAQEIFSDCEETCELNEGYEFVFPGEWTGPRG